MHPEFCACQLAKRISLKADTDQQRANRLGLFYERNVAPLGKEKVAPSDLDPTLFSADGSA